MNLTPENVINIRNHWRVAVAVVWMLLAATTVSNAGYGDTDVEWGFFSLCILLEIGATMAALQVSFRYADEKFTNMGQPGHVTSLKQGLRIANEDIRAAKLWRSYVGLLAMFCSIGSFFVCLFIWVIG